MVVKHFYFYWIIVRHSVKYKMQFAITQGLYLWLTVKLFLKFSILICLFVILMSLSLIHLSKLCESIRLTIKHCQTINTYKLFLLKVFLMSTFRTMKILCLIIYRSSSFPNFNKFEWFKSKVKVAFSILHALSISEKIQAYVL